MTSDNCWQMMFVHPELSWFKHSTIPYSLLCCCIVDMLRWTTFSAWISLNECRRHMAHRLSQIVIPIILWINDEYIENEIDTQIFMTFIMKTITKTNRQWNICNLYTKCSAVCCSFSCYCHFIVNRPFVILNSNNKHYKFNHLQNPNTYNTRMCPPAT